MGKYKLTAKHRAQLKPWADKWIKNALSTKAMDAEERKLCVDAVMRLYDAGGRPRPKHIVFVPSPFVLRFASGYAAAIWYLTRNSNAACRNATHAATDAATDDATYAATYAATDDATRAATHAATYAATRAATDAATHAATDAATRAATYAATDAATDAATYDATHAATYDATRAATNDAIGATWFFMNGGPADLTSKLRLGKFGSQCAQKIWNAYQGGNFWSAWDSYLSFFRHVAKLPLDYSKYDAWETLALHSSVRIVHSDFCMISDRPERLIVDDQSRPHCEDGPFCRWRDGSALYAVHGVRVPMWIIEHPERITVSAINAEQNLEVRRVMIDKYGQEKFIVDSGAQVIHTDDFGSLLRKNLNGDEALVMVKVVNSTPEADGTFKDYFLRVHPELRPLPPGEWSEERKREFVMQQQPQVLTARNAVASTFGLRGEDYDPDLET